MQPINALFRLSSSCPSSRPARSRCTDPVVLLRPVHGVLPLFRVHRHCQVQRLHRDLPLYVVRPPPSLAMPGPPAALIAASATLVTLLLLRCSLSARSQHGVHCGCCRGLLGVLAGSVVPANPEGVCMCDDHFLPSARGPPRLSPTSPTPPTLARPSPPSNAATTTLRCPGLALVLAGPRAGCDWPVPEVRRHVDR